MPEGKNHKPGQVMTRLQRLDPKLRLSENELKQKGDRGKIIIVVVSLKGEKATVEW